MRSNLMYLTTVPLLVAGAMVLSWPALVPSATAAPALRTQDPPAGPNSGMAYLTKDADGQPLLSWLEPNADAGHRLMVARWSGTGWSKAETVASGSNWFVNWADFPSVTTQPDGSLLAHWLQRNAGAGKWGYGIRIARREPTKRGEFGQGRWQLKSTLNEKDPDDYAGFLHFVPSGASGRPGQSGAGAVFLSPPEASAAKPEHAAGASHGDGHEHRKTARFVTFGPDGQIATNEELDADVCSCCQTAVAATPTGLLVAYRDHLPGEIRDISVVRRTGRGAQAKWSAPVRLHDDGWKINGCPTEGPSLAVQGRVAAATWLTRAQERPRLQLAVSSNEGATFSKPVRVDEGNPLGRPMLTPLGKEEFALVWLEKNAGQPANASEKGSPSAKPEATFGAQVRLRRILSNGQFGPSVVIANVPAARTSGFPKVIQAGATLLVVWRDSRLRMTQIALADLPTVQVSKKE